MILSEGLATAALVSVVFDRSYKATIVGAKWEDVSVAVGKGTKIAATWNPAVKPFGVSLTFYQ